MQKITKDLVLSLHSESPRRKCFSENTGLQPNKKKPTFSVHIEGVKKIFEAQTGLELRYNPDPKYRNYFRFVTQQEMIIIEKWAKSLGNIIFLRDCLSISIALDTNLQDNTSGKYTNLGHHENLAKTQQNESSIKALSEASSKIILGMPFYNNADFICAVPPPPEKEFDLPTQISSQVSQIIKKPCITKNFIFGNNKSSVKSALHQDKWGLWDACGLTYDGKNGFDLKGKSVILLDDKYQSGTTIQFVAMKLQEAGAKTILGLSMVKTLRDDDNL